ncbi:MAG TPA: hypothetical protein VJH94_02280 [Candidatus Paceibacterota bacterium]
MGGLESGPGSSRNQQSSRLEFGSKDFLLAEKILNEHASQKSVASNAAHRQEWEFHKRREGNSNKKESTGDIAEAAVFSILNHADNPFRSLENMQVSVELASRGDDILKGFDGVLKVQSGGRQLAEIRYDATTNPAAVLRKIEEAVFYPKDASHTKMVLGFDIGAPDSPWPSVRDGSFSSPSFLLLLKEMETQLKAHDTYAQKTGDTQRSARCQQELLFVRYMLQHTPKAMPVALLHDKVFAAIEEASHQVQQTDPKSFRIGRAKAA